MPPQERRLADILKEEKIPPTKRYAKKPKHLDVFIPFEIPWEHLPSLQTQQGMGAFGHYRDANMKVNQGSKRLIQGNLHSETVIPLFSQAVGNDQSGMLPFGSYRRNISDVIDHHDFDDSKTTQIKYKDHMTPNCDPESHSFISRQFAPTSTEKAGSIIIDRRRNVIVAFFLNYSFHSKNFIPGYGDDAGVFNRASESIMPRLFQTSDICTRTGADFGAFRPLISESEGAYQMSLDDEIKCKLVVPYQVCAYLLINISEKFVRFSKHS
ncbi:unnamed protein product [Thelazia callipaeda]|uniref:Uncharacterized protein n=1 Tax=Thelazia callipaeda TaxID=103827 RepID=A0A158RCY2_THECL|nr:unnamed protein product [Thelazia callipaeda]